METTLIIASLMTVVALIALIALIATAGISAGHDGVRLLQGGSLHVAQRKEISIWMLHCAEE
eukprot:scaffold70145_cov40-Cyclotella_meneghiniana.AAC.1